MPKRAAFERSRRELSLDVSVGVHILLVVEQSSLESQSGGVCQDSDTYGTYTRNASSLFMGSLRLSATYQIPIYLFTYL